jgi:hypothetical protein
MHLSRVLSPVIDILTPSLFAVRAPLFEAPGVEDGTDAVDALRGAGAGLKPLGFNNASCTVREMREFTHLPISRRPWNGFPRPVSPCPPPFSMRARSPWRAQRHLSPRASAISRQRGQLCSPAVMKGTECEWHDTRRNHATPSVVGRTLRTDSVIFASFFNTCRMSTISYSSQELAVKSKRMMERGRRARDVPAETRLAGEF